MRRFGGVLPLGLMGALTCAGQSLPPAAERYVLAEMELNRLPGVAIALVQGGDVTLASYGVTDLGAGTPITPETPVELASLSKPLTALAVARLVHGGALELDRPVVHYLADFEAGHADSGRITVRHLVEHTSGLTRADDYRVPCCGQPGTSDLTAAVQSLRQARPRSRPGERFVYANSNYVLLAALVERVSGESFPAYMQEQVFEPLGMRRTTLDAARAAAWGQAAQHERRWGRFRAVSGSGSGWDGASMVKSTAEDVGRWLSAFLEGRPDFGPHGAASWWLGSQSKAPYEMGWRVHRSAEWLRGELALEHTGFTWGGNTAAVVAPRQGIGVAVLINAGTTRAGPVARGLAARLAGLPGPPPAHAPFSDEADNWAFVIAAAGMVLSAVTLLSGLGAWREWRAGRRRFRWDSSPIQKARSLLLAGMAIAILYMLSSGARPPWTLPASLRLAIPLLGLAAAALLFLAALLGVAPRLPRDSPPSERAARSAGPAKL